MAATSKKIVSLLLTAAFALSSSAFVNNNQICSHVFINQLKNSSSSHLHALHNIAIPSLFSNVYYNFGKEEDGHLRDPQTPCLSFRPLCFSISQGDYVNLLHFKGGGILERHSHSLPMHALKLMGSWGYKEHLWHTKVGTYLFESPGEMHTLIVDKDCNKMIAMFHVAAAILYVEEGEEEHIIGYDDVFTKWKNTKKWYAKCGLGEDYVEQFVR
eukprot:15341144-Ditylum_brightwellii.AAC.1